MFNWTNFLNYPNTGESIDSGLYPVLEKNVVKQRGGSYIKLGETMVDYNENFRFYITTCLRNPHYLPETSVMVCQIELISESLNLN